MRAFCATNNLIVKIGFYEKEREELWKRETQRQREGGGRVGEKAVLKRCAASATDNWLPANIPAQRRVSRSTFARHIGRARGGVSIKIRYR